MTQYQALKAAGKCTRCCRADAEPGFASCPPCRLATRHRLARARYRRAGAGKCLRCEEKREDGYSMCRRHLELHRHRNRLAYVPTESKRSKAIQANRCRARLEGVKVGAAVKGRCRCGLLLPCWTCIPTATEMAESRQASE